eukprot:2113571-Prymnesium_polylepis.1
MWPAALAFFEKGAEEPKSLIDGSLCLTIDGVRDAKRRTCHVRGALRLTCSASASSRPMTR